MKKKKLMPLAKSAFALSLAATMAVPAGIPAAAAKVADADKEVTVPEPIKTIDFNRGLLGVAQDENKDTSQIVGKSEELYVQKTAEEVGTSEKVDANGLVYTGDNSTAAYHKQNVSNQPTTAWDEEKGTVLKIGKTQTIPAIYKTKSAGVADEGITKRLDEELPYETSGAAATVAGVLVQPEQTISSEIIIDNPFGDNELRKSLVEFSEYDNPDQNNGRWTKKWTGDRYQPVWTKGLTFSYWIKVPSNEDGTYKRGSVLRWELDHQLYYQADDYAKYLACSYWDIERQKFADEYDGGSLEKFAERTLAEESGTIYGSDYYFKYEKDWTNGTDENGKPIPKTYSNGASKGPVYDRRALKGEDGYEKSKYYQYGPNFQRGFVLLSDGKFEEMDVKTDDAFYEKYHTLEIEEGSYVRRGYNDGELQIDTDDSIFWVPDNNLAININPNVSYLDQQGMHNGDVFFMNSWQEANSITDKYGNGSYAGAKTYALSPVTSVTENEGKRVATPNGNVDKWHQVTVTLQNDWVEFWVDGEMVNVGEYYSSRGGVSLDNKRSFKRLNKGTGLRGGWGSEKGAITFAYANYVCRLLMDWMTDEEATLHIGGAGKYADQYAQAETSCDFSIDDLKFYDCLLTNEQIVKAYENEVAAMNVSANVAGTAVDITTVSDVSVKAENAVKTEQVTIKGQTVNAVSIAANEKQSTATGAKVANPFAGKNLEGATIGYWVKQADAERTSLLAFMDDEDVEIQSPKDGGSMGKSILSIKNNGAASYVDGYTSSTNTKVKNTYITAVDTTQEAVILNDSAKDWMYVTATMTNAGIKYYINGELVENMATDKAGVRFLDGYFSRLRDEKDVQTKLGAFGGTNNQGTRTLMDFLTSEDTSIYFGYSAAQGMSEMSYDKTSACQFAGVKYVDAALTDEQVKEFYEKSLNANTPPVENDVKLGDVDSNSKIEIKDAQLALKIALNLKKPTAVEKTAADVDENGKVEIKDAQQILRVALNLQKEFTKAKK